MFFDCHYLDDLFTSADLSLVAISVDCEAPDKAQLSKEMPAASQATSVLMCYYQEYSVLTLCGRLPRKNWIVFRSWVAPC